jgi:Transposase IS116/IS110/IS902 family
VGGLAGLTPTPYQSGESAREQGITKSGNRHVRWMTTELAWSWVRYQPESALSCWFKDRFGLGGEAFEAHWDCGRGAQVADCPLAVFGNWRVTRRRSAQRGISHLPARWRISAQVLVEATR